MLLSEKRCWPNVKIFELGKESLGKEKEPFLNNEKKLEF